jgi:hypothetical protein
MRLVYYSLANSPSTIWERQWINSIRTLRRHNPSIPICLFLFNGATAELLREAERWRVHVQFLGDYREFLQQRHIHGSVLARYPTFHKFLSLAHNPFHDATQVLYLDCDTFFFDDVEVLFEQYQHSDWYAREEPMSWRSRYAYAPEHIDEGLLQAIAQHERLRYVIPFNSGVCLLNHSLWATLERITAHYLDFAWRLLCGREINGPAGLVHDCQIQEAVARAVSDFDHARALPYPSMNTWIIEQIALWLALGCLPRMSQGVFSTDHVLQGGEYEEMGHHCVLAHYFSTHEREFFSSLAAHRASAVVR